MIQKRTDLSCCGNCSHYLLSSTENISIGWCGYPIEVDLSKNKTPFGVKVFSTRIRIGYYQGTDCTFFEKRSKPIEFLGFSVGDEVIITTDAYDDNETSFLNERGEIDSWENFADGSVAFCIAMNGELIFVGPDEFEGVKE